MNTAYRTFCLACLHSVQAMRETCPGFRRLRVESPPTLLLDAPAAPSELPPLVPLGLAKKVL